MRFRNKEYDNKSLPDEVWVKVDGWEDSHEISNLGRVRSLKRNLVARTKILKGFSDPFGYIKVELRNHPKISVAFVHRLVAGHFIDNPENKPQVNHLDGDPTNNRADNLEWCTNSENQLHSYTIGRVPVRNEDHANCKLTSKEVKKARELFKTGRYTRQQLADKFNVGKSLMAYIISGERRIHV